MSRYSESASGTRKATVRLPDRLPLTLLWLVCSASFVAGSDRWVSLGPIGQGVSTVQVDPASSSILFALGGGVYKTTDSGGSWAELPDPAGTEAYRSGLGPLAIGAGSPSTPFLGMRIYRANPIPLGPPILVDSALLRSPDGGSNFYRTSLPAPRALTVVTQSPTSIFAAVTLPDASFLAGRGLFESRDDGATWTRIFDADVTAVAVSQNTSLTLYAVTPLDGLWKSEDGGANWAPANAGLMDPSATSNPVTNLAIDPSDPNTVYVSTISYYFNSAPPTVSSTVNLFRSSDAARSWTRMSYPPALIGSLVVLADSRALYAGTPQGVFRSLDGGLNWVDASDGLTSLAIWALVADPSSRNLYAATGTGVFRLEPGRLHPPARIISFH